MRLSLEPLSCVIWTCLQPESAGCCWIDTLSKMYSTNQDPLHTFWPTLKQNQYVPDWVNTNELVTNFPTFEIQIRRIVTWMYFKFLSWINRVENDMMVIKVHYKWILKWMKCYITIIIKVHWEAKQSTVKIYRIFLRLPLLIFLFTLLSFLTYAWM